MNEVSTTAIADTPTATLPPIACAPWCEAGDGHVNRSHPEDQYCLAGFLEIELHREAPEQITDGGPFFLRAMTVSLEQDPFSEPHLVLSGAGHIKATVSEAERYAKHILHLVALSRGEVEATRS
jgi:hypothetical protein